MKPMVCKTPREREKARRQKRDGGNTPEIVRVGSIVCGREREGERERQSERRLTKGENKGSRECVVINEFRAGENAT